MLHNMSFRKIVFLIGLPMLGLCATAFYLLNKKEDDDLEETLQSAKATRSTTVEMKIPKENVGTIIGRAGNTIKEIQEQSKAKINFKGEENDDIRTCVIRGMPEATITAEKLIRELIMNQPLIEIYDMFVPQKACGRIIGRCGDNIRAISKASNAKITVDSSGDVKKDRRIQIKGTMEQISVAKSLILEKVEEDAEVRQRMEHSQANKAQRNHTSYPARITASPSPAKNDANDTGSLEPMLATGSDGFLHVFASAVTSPDKFWVQILGPRSGELDRLVEDMTAYYSLEENKKAYSIKELTIGQVVAAPFNFDMKYYRAEVKKIELNDCDPNENKIELYYVDYGDSEFRKQSELLQMRLDFLSLRFQAIECKLAKVKPSGSADWSEASIDCFEALCHVAQWTVLMARVVTFKEIQRNQREGSPVPSVDLIDTSGPEDINVAEELVKQGLAVYVEENKDSTLFVNKHVDESNVKCTAVKTNQAMFRPAGESDSEDSEDQWDEV